MQSGEIMKYGICQKRLIVERHAVKICVLWSLRITHLGNSLFRIKLFQVICSVHFGTFFKVEKVKGGGGYM